MYSDTSCKTTPHSEHINSSVGCIDVMFSPCLTSCTSAAGWFSIIFPTTIIVCLIFLPLFRLGSAKSYTEPIVSKRALRSMYSAIVIPPYSIFFSISYKCTLHLAFKTVDLLHCIMHRE